MRTHRLAYLLLIFGSLLAWTGSSAQFTIPNADFEEWGFNGWNYFPIDWQTGNTSTMQDTFQDMIPYEGEYAMRVVPIPTGNIAEGEASISIPTEVIPESLDFYVRYQRTETTYLGVTIEFYNNENMFYAEQWQAPDTVSDWMPVSMPLQQIEPDMTHAVIRVGALIGDLLPGSGWIAVDAMSVGGPNAVVEIDRPSFSIYPVPAHDEVMLEVDGQWQAQRISIHDAMGRKVMEAPYSRRVPLDDLPDGWYTLTLADGEGRMAIKSFSIQGE